MLPSAGVIVKAGRYAPHSVPFVLWGGCLIKIAQFWYVRDLVVDDFDGAETIAFREVEFVFLHKHLLLVNTRCNAAYKSRHFSE